MNDEKINELSDQLLEVTKSIRELTKIIAELQATTASQSAIILAVVDTIEDREAFFKHYETRFLAAQQIHSLGLKNLLVDD
jgi:hypothetical protein